MKIERLVVGPIETNCYIVMQDRECFIVDPGADSEAIKKFIYSEMLTVDFIVYTHGHADHIVAGPDFDVPMFIHKDEEAFLYDSKLNLSCFSTQDFVFGDKCQVNGVQDGDNLLFQGNEIKIIHTPGHTAGGICLYVDKVLFSGDTLFNRSIGRTDLPTGDQAVLLSAIKKKLFILPDQTVVYPGHGEFTTIGEEKQNNPFFT